MENKPIKLELAGVDGTFSEPKWKQTKSKCTTFQYGDHPELIHIIKTGFEDKYMVVYEDAYELNLGKVEFHTRQSIKDTFDIEIDVEYPDMVLVNEVLTDFSKDTWEDTNMKSVHEALTGIAEKLSNHTLIGMVTSQDDMALIDQARGYMDLPLSNAAFYITNARVEGSCIIGDVHFLKIRKGLVAKNLIDCGFGKYALVCLGKYNLDEQNEYEIKEIIRWDIIPK